MVNNKNEWFSTWFDSPLYHILYRSHDQVEANNFLDLLIDHLAVQQGSKILDLGCGRGRYAKYLGAKGFDVLGIDLSQNSIRYAQNFEQDNLHFEVHDMRDSFGPRKFDYVLNLFTSFGYFRTEKEDLSVLDSVRKSLSEDGVFIVDFINVEKAEQNLIGEETLKLDNIIFKITRWIESGTIYKKIEVNKQIFREEVKLLSLAQFQSYAKSTGFILSETFGDYQLNPFDQRNSERLIMVFLKDAL